MCNKKRKMLNELGSPTYPSFSCWVGHVSTGQEHSRGEIVHTYGVVAGISNRANLPDQIGDGGFDSFHGSLVEG